MFSQVTNERDETIEINILWLIRTNRHINKNNNSEIQGIIKYNIKFMASFLNSQVQSS